MFQNNVSVRQGIGESTPQKQLQMINMFDMAKKFSFFIDSCVMLLSQRLRVTSFEDGLRVEACVSEDFLASTGWSR